jgi:hypothetical protein
VRRRKLTGLEAALEAMEPEFLSCRDFGHGWMPHNARYLPESKCYESQLRCSRCGTIRTRHLSMSGAQLSSAYDYTPGYQIAGMGRLTGTDRDVIRLRSILALLPEEAKRA